MNPYAKPSLNLITTFGLGHMRPFPGTWGSLPPVVVALVMVSTGLGPIDQPWIYRGTMAAMVLLFSWACIRDGSKAEARFLRKDPSPVVADETAGQALVLMAIPAATTATPGLAAFTILFAFVGFRIMDILKPWPAQQLQKIPSGWGILLDDLFAGLYANLALVAAFLIATR